MSFSYRDLEIWQLGVDLAEHVYKLTTEFPTDERFGITSQLRRATVSVPSNISEGWGRNSKANLAHFVNIARGSLSELETLIELSRRFGYISDEDTWKLVRELETLGRKSYAFLKSLTDTVRESEATYSVVPLDSDLITISEDYFRSEPVTRNP